MHVFVDQQRVTLKDSDLVGEGGEARVYRHGGVALKLFHPATDALTRRLFDLKVTKLRRFPLGLPREVVAPTGLVRDDRQRLVGYQMPLISGAEDFGRLSSRKWRAGAVSNDALMALFRSLHDAVAGLHGQGVVVGDLNDGNVLFSGSRPFLIDADSMQFGGFPCAVGHEKYLDPRLYGVDLTTTPRFDAGTDWYAFAVLLCSSLLYVHPFGGMHATLPTLLRRAEARHSVFRSDVTLPRLAATPKVLPDDLAHHFLSVLEKDERAAFPRALLELPWTTCNCGLEHARAVCPDCHALGPLVTRQVLRTKGRCTARVAFETSGRILAAALQGGLRYVCEEQGLVRREDGAVVLPQVAGAGLRFAISGASTWVADGSGRVLRVEGGQVVERARTDVRLTTPVLAASAAVAYRQEQGWLVEQRTGARVGQALEGQTWLWTGERLGLGFYRAGGLTVAFLLRAGRSGLKQLDGVTWSGRIVEADAVFDAQHALLTVVTEAQGREVVRRWLFDEAGTSLGRSEGGSTGHAALLGGRVVLATDGGLVALKRDSGHLIEAVQFPDTQDFVSAGDEVLANTDGSLFVVGARDITQLTLT
ncbi:MAG: hypothetical protein IT380_27995 [Myxococcales bacterium]|nr:hypothetical protein [Myxococcales bacterium]